MRTLSASRNDRSIRPDRIDSTSSANAVNRVRFTRLICSLTCCGKTSALTAPELRMPIVTSVTRVIAERKAASGCCHDGMPMSAAV